MRRPFAVLGFAAFAVLALAAVLGPGLARGLAWTCAGLGFCALLTAAVTAVRAKRGKDQVQDTGKQKKYRIPRTLLGTAALLTASLSLFLFCRTWETGVEPFRKLDGVEARVRGQVLDYPQHSGSGYGYLLRVQRVEAEGFPEETEPFVVRLSASPPFLCRPYDQWEGKVRFFAYSSRGGLYSSQNSWLAKGVTLGAYLTGYDDASVVSQVEQPPGKLFAELRHLLSRNFARHLPREEAALLQAMLLGQRDALPDRVYEDFKQIGSSHLLVISGLHMAALAALLSLLFGRLPLGRAGRNLLTAGALLCFLALTAFPVSALRSGIMYLLFLLADCFGRKPDGVNSLGFAVLAICLQNPFAGMDLGFALSVLATLGILLLYPSLYRAFLRPFGKHPRLFRAMKPAAASLAVTVSAVLFTLPLQLLVFGGIPLLGPLANLALALPCTLLLYSAFAGVLFLLLPALAPLAAPFLFCTGWMARFALWAARMLGGIPGMFLDLRQGVWPIVLGGILLLAMAARLPRKRDPAAVWAAALLSAALVVLGGIFEAWQWHGVVTVAVADPEGSSSVAVFKDGEAALLAAGGYRTGAARDLLVENHVGKLRTLYLPDRGAQAREAASLLLRTYRAQRVLVPQGAYTGEDLFHVKTETPPEAVELGGSFEAVAGVEVSVSPEGSRLSFWANGVRVVLELADSGAGCCGLLVTNQRHSRVNSAFTVFQTDGIIEETFAPGDGAAVRAGYDLLPAEQGSLYLDILRDGSLQIRRGS